MGIKGSLELLVSIEKMSFISKVGVDSLRISQIKWGITQSGKSFLKIYNKEKEIHNFGIVMTIPPPQSHTFFEKHPKIKKTEIAFKELFANAEKEIRILSPYIDASIINFFEKIQPNVSVRIITLPNQFSSKNAILERLKSKINLNVKYIKEVREGAQLYQIHAKIILVDGKFIEVRGFKYKIPVIYGIDFYTHDIPTYVFATSENYLVLKKFFSSLRLLNYPLQSIVSDDNINFPQACF